MYIPYLNRKTGKEEKEEVYGGFFIELLYGTGLLSSLLSWVLWGLSRIPFFSWGYGKCQKSSWSRRKVRPFIQRFGIDTSEFLLPVEAFSSFNDFFIRKLKPEARPIASDPKTLIMPADGRYLVFPNISESEGFWVKGKKFSLEKLLGSKELSSRYENGSMAIIRLCPTDYHRFHFPCDGVASPSKLINGCLYSVNPKALQKNIEILSENKREITEIESEVFGKILYIEVGATHVGSICQTYVPGKCSKGEEKGFFEFGGSCLILLFEEGKITFDSDLVLASSRTIEVRGLLGESLGVSK